KGDGRSYELQYTWNKGGTHPIQTHSDGNRFYYVKGDSGEYEELWADGNTIYRGIDTSEAPDKYYIQYTGDTSRYGAAWCPRFMHVGQSFNRSPYVVHYWQHDCSERGPKGTVPSSIKLLAHYTAYEFPSGIVL